MRRFLLTMMAVLTVALLAVALMGCAAGKAPCAKENPNLFSLDIDWPTPLSFSSAKPICVPEGSCLAVEGESWRMLSPCGEAQSQLTEQSNATIPTWLLMRLAPAEREAPPTSWTPRVVSRTVVPCETPPAGPLAAGE